MPQTLWLPRDEIAYTSIDERNYEIPRYRNAADELLNR